MDSHLKTPNVTTLQMKWKNENGCKGMCINLIGSNLRLHGTTYNLILMSFQKLLSMRWLNLIFVARIMVKWTNYNFPKISLKCRKGHVHNQSLLNSMHPFRISFCQIISQDFKSCCLYYNIDLFGKILPSGK